MPYEPAVEQAAADALVEVIGDSKWEAVAFAKAYLEVIGGGQGADERATRIIYDGTGLSLKDSKVATPTLAAEGFLAKLTPRKNTGSAANPITKMFPAAITEERFLDLLVTLCAASKSGLTFSDERHASHSFVDFVLIQGNVRLPINVKNAGTRFENAMDLVGLAPDDCIPIPAYKAYGAIEESPSLIYVVAADYDLLRRLKDTIPGVFSERERIVWDLLNKHTGTHVRHAEDRFVYGMVKKYDAVSKFSSRHDLRSRARILGEG